MMRKSRKPRPFWSKSRRRWIARITINGKRMERSLKAKDEAYQQIEDWWDLKKSGVNAGDYTLQTFVDEWLTERSLKPSSRERYQRWIAHIGTSGEIPLNFLKRKHIVDLLRKINRTATRNAVRSLLRTILADAVERELIATNPVASVKKTKHTKRPVEIFTPEEVAAILEAVKGHHYQAAVQIALEVGLRPGELWGLRWSDLNGGTLSVERTVTVVDGQLAVTEQPKTAAGRRQIPLSTHIISALNVRRKVALTAGLASKDCPMFPGHRGTLTWPSNFRAQFKTILKTAGVKQRHLYTCRHTAASTMLNGGLPLPIVAAILGHKSGEVTLRVYSHLIGSEVDRAKEFWNQRHNHQS